MYLLNNNMKTQQKYLYMKLTTFVIYRKGDNFREIPKGPH